MTILPPKPSISQPNHPQRILPHFLLPILIISPLPIPRAPHRHPLLQSRTHPTILQIHTPNTLPLPPHRREHNTRGPLRGALERVLDVRLLQVAVHHVQDGRVVVRGEVGLGDAAGVHGEGVDDRGVVAGEGVGEPDVGGFGGGVGCDCAAASEGGSFEAAVGAAQDV